MKYTPFLLSVSALFFSLFSYSQEAEKQQVLEDLIEEIASNSEQELDYTTLFDDLQFYFQNPLNLNEAQAADLERLHFLNEIQINNLLQHLKTHGEMLTIYELQTVEGFSTADIQRLLPFVAVVPVAHEPFRLGPALRYGRHQTYWRSQWVVEEQAGFAPITDSLLAESPNSRYLGDKYKHYFRYAYHYKTNLYWGLTAEKDVGEEFFNGSNENGFDYYSAHFYLRNAGRIKALAAGDYTLQFGQGLVLWSGMSMGKSSYVLNIKKKAKGVYKYSSTDENNFLRGGASTVALGNFYISGFYSKNRIDANITLRDTIENDIEEISSLQATGYHSTPNELEDKDAISTTLYGGNISYLGEKFRLGLTATHYYFGATLNKTDYPYNRYQFEGQSNSNAGIDYQVDLQHVILFGETAVSENRALATINGAMFELAPQVGLSVVHRSYSRDYQAYYSGAFSEGSHAQNESGLYVGLEVHPFRKWTISAFADMYRFHWLRSRVAAPSSGAEYFLQADFVPSRQLSMYWRFRQESKPENQTIDMTDINPLLDVKRMAFRYHFAYQVSEQVTLRNRLEYAYYRKGDAEKEEGWLVYQDVKYQPARWPLALNVRLALFDTDTYNSRIYAYENDVLYAFSIPAYYSKGTRMYAVLKYSPSRWVDIWLRYAEIYYRDKRSIGSGLTEIQGNKKSEIKLQVRFTF